MERTDTARAEIYSGVPTDRREPVVRVWYPAAAAADATPAPYLPPAWSAVGELLGVEVAGLRSHAKTDATVQVEVATDLSFMDVPFPPRRDGAAVVPMVSATAIAPSACGGS